MKSFALIIAVFLIAQSCAQPCKEGEVLCEGTEDECIPEEYVCDYVYKDCSNDADEIGCPCPPDEFGCNDGQCIPGGWRCDGDRDCPSGEDENNCECIIGHVCSDGKCVPNTWVCDGEWDCSDDEANCTCDDSYFKCDDGLCIPGSWECDDYPDCRDESDERSCSVATLNKHPQVREDYLQNPRRARKPTSIAQMAKSKVKRNHKKSQDVKRQKTFFGSVGRRHYS